MAIQDKIVRDYQNFPLTDAHQQTREKGAEIFDMDLFESFAEMKMNDYKEGRILQG